jgi:L-fuculose-phosphate aldolase
MNIRALKKEIIAIGRQLYERGLVTAKSGNISARLDPGTIIITATGTNLCALRPSDLVRVRLSDGKCLDAGRPSSELPMHALIYANFGHKRVIHCHPALTNAYFALYPRLKELVYETRYTIGEVPVVPQQTVTVTRPRPVVEALKKNPLVVLKNHGVVAAGDDFKKPFDMIEALESGVKVAAVARLFDKRAFDSLGCVLKRKL